MAPAILTPPASGTATPTFSSLTKDQAQSQASNSNQPASNGSSNLAPLDASLLQTTLTTSPREVPAPDDPSVASANVCTDHMITAQWTDQTGWAAPQLKPYGPLSIMPTASVLHYATECFEGLKLYRGHDSKLRLFRPSRNAARMRRSCARIALPDFAESELEKLILALCARDGAKWLPKSRCEGKFLYLRPTMIANDPGLGVQVPKAALLYVILVMFPDLSKPTALGPSVHIPASAAPLDGGVKTQEHPEVEGLKLLASKEDTIRAWPGGFGFAKLGANYGPSLMAAGEARQRGFNQILWLFGSEAFVTEAGASNFFVVWRTRQGGVQLVTAPLDEGIILEGVTRASILELARSRLQKEGGLGGEETTEAVEVLERKFTMEELDEAVQEGRLLEAFAAGTAYFVAGVGLIEWKGKELKVPCQSGMGKYTRLLRGWLEGIMYGPEEHEWGVVVEEQE